MKLKTTLFGETYRFDSVRDVLNKAGELRSGDVLAGVAASSMQERVAAKAVLAELLLRDLRENPAVPYEQDEVTRIIQDDLNERIYAEMQNWTVSDLREWILSETTTTADLRRASRGLTSEMVAAVCKLMPAILISSMPRARFRSRPTATRPSACRARCRAACSRTTRRTMSTASSPPCSRV